MEEVSWKKTGSCCYFYQKLKLLKWWVEDRRVSSEVSSVCGLARKTSRPSAHTHTRARVSESALILFCERYRIRCV